MITKLVITLLICLILFLILDRNLIKGVSVLVFLITFDIIDPIGSLWGVPAKFFTSTIFIVVAYITLFKRNLIIFNNKILSDNYKIAFLLVWGFSIGLIYIGEMPTVDQYTISTLNISPLNQLIINFVNGIVLLLFLQILYIGTPNLQSLLKHIEWFCYSIFLHLLNPLVFFINGKTIYQWMGDAPDPMSSIRIGGLFFNFEFTTDYVLIVIIFSLILLFFNKRLPLLYIFLAMVLGLLTGSRSFLILLLIQSAAIILFIGNYSRKFRFSFLIITVFVFGILFYLNQRYSSEIVVLNHLNKSFASFEDKDVDEALNRPYEDSWDILARTPITGFGNFNHIISFKSLITSHFLLLHIYVKFGIIGILIFLWIYFRDIAKLFLLQAHKKIRYTKYLLIILLIILFLQNLKISFIRYSTTIYIYGFIYFIIQFFLHSNRQCKSILKRKIASL